MYLSIHVLYVLVLRCLVILNGVPTSSSYVRRIIQQYKSDYKYSDINPFSKVHEPPPTILPEPDILLQICKGNK